MRRYPFRQEALRSPGDGLRAQDLEQFCAETLELNNLVSAVNLCPCTGTKSIPASPVVAVCIHLANRLALRHACRKGRGSPLKKRLFGVKACSTCLIAYRYERSLLVSGNENLDPVRSTGFFVCFFLFSFVLYQVVGWLFGFVVKRQHMEISAGLRLDPRLTHFKRPLVHLTGHRGLGVVISPR